MRMREAKDTKVTSDSVKEEGRKEGFRRGGKTTEITRYLKERSRV